MWTMNFKQINMAVQIFSSLHIKIYKPISY